MSQAGTDGAGAKPSEETKDLKKIYALAILHMAQYFPQGFTQQALPALFRQQGLPLDKFWLLSLPTWPRWIKFLIAAVVDNVGSMKFGYRRSWFVPCTAISALLYLSLAFVDPVPSAIALIVTILVIKSLFMTAQDVAVDAYCSESFNDAERPTGAAAIVFLASLGGFIGAACIALIETVGWSITMTLASLLLVAAALPAILRPEPPPPPEMQRRRERGEIANPLRALFRKDSLLVMPHCFSQGWIDSFAFTMVLPFFIDHGMTLTEYGIYLPCVGIIGRGSAALIVPRVIEKVGLRAAGIIGAAGYALEGVLYSTLAARGELPPLWLLVAMVATLNMVYNHYLMAVNTSRYAWVSKAQAGTDYSMGSSFYFLGLGLGQALCGFLADAIGYRNFFVISFAIATGLALFYSFTVGKTDRMVARREEKA